MVNRKLSSKSRQKGLIRAREVRKRRAELKERLKKGKVNLGSIFTDKNIFEYAANMKLVELIGSLPGVGSVRAESILVNELGISLSKKVGGMGRKQKIRFFNYFKIS
jgi:hypothetical protein